MAAALGVGVLIGYVLARASARDAAKAQVAELATEALAANNSQFLTMANERLGRAQAEQRADLDRGTRNVTALVEPLTAALQEVNERLQFAEKERDAAKAALDAQLALMRTGTDSLRAQTAELITALRSSSTRGTWGETQLRRVVEAAGMMNRVDFIEQAATQSGQRPDLVVQLAGGKHLVVDSKVTLLAYLDAQSAADPVQREERLAAHARQFRTHIDSLASKAYWDQFESSPEFVVMFVPAEPFFAAAIETDPALFEYAFDKKVVIATPMTLLALLRTSAYAWRQEAVAGNAREVLRAGKELHQRLGTMGSHLTKLGKAIGGAADAYNATIGTLESRVLVSARRLSDLDVVEEPLAELPHAEVGIRRLSSVELLADEETEAVTGTRSDEVGLAGHETEQDAFEAAIAEVANVRRPDVEAAG